MAGAQEKARGHDGPRITISLSAGDHAALSAMAERCDVSLSRLTRQAISEFLARNDEGDLQLPLKLNTGRNVRHG